MLRSFSLHQLIYNCIPQITARALDNNGGSDEARRREDGQWVQRIRTSIIKAKKNEVDGGVQMQYGGKQRSPNSKGKDAVEVFSIFSICLILCLWSIDNRLTE